MPCSIWDTQIIRVWVKLLNAVRTDFSVTCESRTVGEHPGGGGKRLTAYSVDGRTGAMVQLSSRVLANTAFSPQHCKR